jgi:hypothetical protein
MAAEYFAPTNEAEGGSCDDIEAWGEKSNITPQYIAKIKVEPQDTYPPDACPPYVYGEATIDVLRVEKELGTDSVTKVLGSTGTFSGLVSAGSFSANSKAFDIPHPTRENRRLVHGCLEGPEYGVYTRGRVTNKKEIILPSYWEKLVDWTTITVNLTPIGSHQSVIVKRFDEKKIYLQSNGGMPIDCFYHVYAERMDIPRIEIEPEVDTES